MAAKPTERVVMLADAQSFYASVEKAARPEYRDRPLAVAGDPERRSGIILAACPLAKRFGVKTGDTLGEAFGKCPHLVAVRPRMHTYLRVSAVIAETLGAFTDLVEPYSVDEYFLDVTGSTPLFGPPETIARLIQDKVELSTGVRMRIGIGPTKVLAKMAADLWAKQNESGIFTLPAENVATLLWPRPIGDLFGVGARMEHRFVRMGLATIGDVARLPLEELKKRLRLSFGHKSDARAEYYWKTAHGIDPGPVVPPDENGAFFGRKSIGRQITLPRDYRRLRDIRVVLLELSDEVCRSCRSEGRLGRIVAVGAWSGDFDRPQGFFRQTTLADATCLTDEVYAAACRLFERHWTGFAVRRLAVTLADLSDAGHLQLAFFADRDRRLRLEQATDDIRYRFGATALIRASSLLAAGQARKRSTRIGGHPA
ncbi:MAG: DNA polymerase IV [Candidatus Reconcilbacillus cellulovorans]|uniref:DNA polymerase IV n=1 Tax=Candidatus Reconcilbacillus cellulovorans TaxID=1906605 RepID=A0A2A6E1V9_9BACL|nr:MAG: DNA polymerase IV [Candidatus Reconcilbacillus cellulovorans]